MTLLNSEEEVKEKNKGKKLIILLLILSILLLIGAIIGIMLLSNQEKPKQYAVYIDDVALPMNTGIFMVDEQENKYVSIRDIAGLVGSYEYIIGEYQNYIEQDKNKGYLQNQYEIVGFEGNSNKIYKTVENTIIDYQYYDLKSKILNSNDKLYINIKDLSVAFNVTSNYNEANGRVNIYTPAFLAESYKKKITEQNDKATLSTEKINNKVIYEGLLVVSNNSKFGILNTSLETIVSLKYNNILYQEYIDGFFVTSDKNLVGVIDKEGDTVIEPKYDSMRAINYSPVLYEVKDKNKFGVIDVKGKIIVNIEYDKLGATRKYSRKDKFGASYTKC